MTYTVTFKSNDGQDTTLYTRTVTAPATTVTDFPANPSRSGYAFTGWNTQDDGEGTPFTALTTVSGDITVYAQWTVVPPNSHAVTFMQNDETGAVYGVKTAGPPLNAIGSGDFPDNPSRSGYTFGGWNTAAEGSGSGFTALTTVSENITVYAQWTATPPGSFTVTFMADDETDAPLGVKNAVDGNAIRSEDFPAPPSRTGYNFGGWYTEKNGGGTPFTAATTVSVNITVYAKWNSYSYTVTFDKNGGTTGADPADKTVNSPDTTIDSLPAVPSRSGYVFVTWNTRQDGGGNEFTAATPVTGNITVYAQWVYSYTVTFDSDGGTTEADPATKTVTGPDTTIDSLPAAPAKTGYLFGGWYTQQNGGGSAFDASTTVSGAITVYAKWNNYSYAVTFNSDGGTTEADPATKNVASPAINVGSLPDPPTKTGYHFGGWYTEQNGGGTAFDASTTVGGSLTVYARWGYLVRFDKNGGDTEADPAERIVSPGPAGTLPAPPTWSGYAFNGWNTQPGGGGSAFDADTTVTGDITVYAQWSGAGITFLDTEDDGDGAFEDGDFTLSKDTNDSQTLIITGADYTNPRWLVDGILKGTDTSIIIDAADYRLGPHNLSLLVTKNGATWSKDIVFTVTD